MASAYLKPPYDSVQNSYSQVVGNVPPVSSMPQSGPVQYNMPISSLRPAGDKTTIKTVSDLTPEERIRSMADKQYQKWAADRQFKTRIMDDFSAASAEATAGLPGTRYDNYSFVQGDKGTGYGQGSSGLNQTPFGQYMSSQGAAGLTGGSTSSVEQRYRQWNNQIADQNQAYQQSMAPVWQKYGIKAPATGIQSLNSW